MISNKTISLDPNLWNNKKTRKRKPKSNTDSQPLQNFDSQFTHQLNQLNQLNQLPTEQPYSSDPPPYSNIKHGSKPTYKMLYNTTAKSHPPPLLNNTLLGKVPSQKSAKICIRGKKSRRKIKKYIKNLTNESLTDIKNQLYNSSLIRCGSAAPPDVLKEIYKNSKLAGKITNTNGDVLLHNFYQNPDPN